MVAGRQRERERERESESESESEKERERERARARAREHKVRMRDDFTRRTPRLINPPTSLICLLTDRRHERSNIHSL